MVATKYAELEIRTWEDVLADALDDLTSPSSLFRAWSAVGMLRCFQEFPTPEALLRKNAILDACEELAVRKPELLVSRAVDAVGESAGVRKLDLWFRWSADAAGLSAMKLAAAELGFPLELANPLQRGRVILDEWERAIRVWWHDLAGYGLDLARSQVESWREGGGFSGCDLFLEVLEFAQAEAVRPGSYQVCLRGFGAGDASSHVVMAESDVIFARHLATCTLCTERVAAFKADEEDGDAEAGRVIPLRRPIPLAADSGAGTWRAEEIVLELGLTKVWMNPDDVLIFTAEQFEAIASVSSGGIQMERIEANKSFTLPLTGVTREQRWQAKICIRLERGGEPIVLRHE